MRAANEAIEEGEGEEQGEDESESEHAWHETELSIAAALGDLKLVRTLLSNPEVDVNEKSGEHGFTALHNAVNCYDDSPPHLQHLLMGMDAAKYRKYSPPKVQDVPGVVNCLVDAGADLEEEDQDERDLLAFICHYASIEHPAPAVEMATLTMDLGIECEEALVDAALNGIGPLVEALLENGHIDVKGAVHRAVHGASPARDLRHRVRIRI